MDTEYVIRLNGPNTAAPGRPVVEVDSWGSQQWVNGLLEPPPEVAEGQPVEAAGTLSIPAGPAAEFEDLVKQLGNEIAVSKVDANGYGAEVWQKADAAIANDLRDCVRYARAGLKKFLRGRDVLDDLGPTPREPGGSGDGWWDSQADGDPGGTDDGAGDDWDW